MHSEGLNSEGLNSSIACFQPLAGWRHIEVTERRTKADFAKQMKNLVDVYYREADVIRLVVDNLNIHTPSALYEVFPAEEARRIIQKLEFHYTPKHASWLNQVEIELSVLSRQCLERRIPNTETLTSEIFKSKYFIEEAFRIKACFDFYRV